MSKREIEGVAFALRGKLEEYHAGLIDHLDLGDWLEENGPDVLEALMSCSALQPQGETDVG